MNLYVTERGNNTMKTMQFAAICLYYYCMAAVKNPLCFITFLSLVFITHKLAGWAVWVMSL